VFPFGARIGAYLVEGLLGEGGTSEVYSVRRDDECFALKILKAVHQGNPALQARLMNEAEALRRLEVPGVVRVFDAGDEARLPFLVMERLTNSLSARLAEPLPPLEAVKLIRQIARILSDLHARGVVHRDVKPSNLLFAADGSLRLSDFGHAKLDAGKLPILPHSTETGTFVGTREYAAPEQLVDAKHVTGSADVYSLGVILFEALAGHRPWSECAPEDLARRRLTERAPRVFSPLFTLSSKLVALVGQMLDPCPQKRPTAQEVYERFGTLFCVANQENRAPLLQITAILFLPVFLSNSYVPAQWSDRVSSPQTAVALPDAKTMSQKFGEALDQESLETADQLLFQFEGLQNTPIERAKFTQKKADFLRELGRIPEARLAYKSAKDAFLEPANKRNWAACAIREADMLMHLGEPETARDLYEDATEKHSVNGTQQRDTRPTALDLHLALFHQGESYKERLRFDRAREKFVLALDVLSDAQTDGLWKARTQERLAGLPGTENALALARSSILLANELVAKVPQSRRAQMTLSRALFRQALLVRDPEGMAAVLANLHKTWFLDKRRGPVAHDYAELLVEGFAAFPQQTAWRLQAIDVLNEMKQRGQWMGDVHVDAWKKRLSP